ncbi:hypothetical protein NCAS_0G01790 [Naumovozyma castellii]|uniref:Protein SWT21 n=1 Tax=Naumovozyma castellii TaxID=27288 RepID=G0VI32_NAUCA|nr:hypothetical protein NCAS_0G01790 [Naumovozyma castellii CBS 4309]CCC71066.1 hypothetical protein NCAS_0G01790 [Naumovozyma castellii CBS 4309]
MNQGASRECRIICSTGAVFDNNDLKTVWELEDSIWAQTTHGVSYTFPELGQSIYKDDEKELQKTIICQDLIWSKDGTSLVTIHNDYGIRQYLIPEEEETEAWENDDVKQLIPFTRFFKNQSMVSSKVHPYYSLYNDDPKHNTVLLASRDVPLQLYSVDNSHQGPICNYETMDSNTERYETAYSIDYMTEKEFLVGFMKNRINLYNVNRRNPVWSIQPATSKSKISAKAIVSCFDEVNFNGDGYYSRCRLAGTYKNEIYRIDTRVSPSQDLVYQGDQTHNSGLIQILNSLNGNYVYLIKRNSITIDVLDRRLNFQRVNQLPLPFNMGNHKFKASLSSQLGLIMGTNAGYLIQWDNDTVEFGGVPRQARTSITAETGCRISFPQRDTHRVAASPDGMSVAVAHENGLSIARLG